MRQVICATCEQTVEARLTTLSETHPEKCPGNKSPMYVCDTCGGCVGVDTKTYYPMGNIGNTTMRDLMKDITHLRNQVSDEMPQRWVHKVRITLRKEYGLKRFYGNRITSEENGRDVLRYMDQQYGRFLASQVHD